MFDEKNNKLRQNLARVRQSRDNLKDRLKLNVTWHKNIDNTMPAVGPKVTFNECYRYSILTLRFIFQFLDRSMARFTEN